MPDIYFQCGKCGKQLEVDAAGAGMQVNCPSCGTSLIVPDSQSDGGESPPLPASIIFPCKRCNQSITTTQSHLGKVVQCPNCKIWVPVTITAESDDGEIEPPPQQDDSQLNEPTGSVVPTLLTALKSQLKHHVIAVVVTIVSLLGIIFIVAYPKGSSSTTSNIDRQAMSGVNPILQVYAQLFAGFSLGISYLDFVSLLKQVEAEWISVDKLRHGDVGTSTLQLINEIGNARIALLNTYNIWKFKLDIAEDRRGHYTMPTDMVYPPASSKKDLIAAYPELNGALIENRNRGESFETGIDPKLLGLSGSRSVEHVTDEAKVFDYGLAVPIMMSVASEKMKAAIDLKDTVARNPNARGGQRLHQK